MKNLRKFFKELWMVRYELLKILAYVITCGWFTYVVSIVYNSDTGILGKILFTVWSLVLTFLFLVYKVNNDNG